MHPGPYSLLTASKREAGVLNGLGPPVAFHLPGVTQLPASKNFTWCKWEISISERTPPRPPIAHQCPGQRGVLARASCSFLSSLNASGHRRGQIVEMPT